jgi:hypothetical protein
VLVAKGFQGINQNINADRRVQKEKLLIYLTVVDFAGAVLETFRVVSALKATTRQVGNNLKNRSNELFTCFPEGNI